MQHYFSHDSNARNSDKITKARMRHGLVAYAVYFCILEKLREEKSHMCIKDYNIIAFELRVDASLVKSVVEDFGLFVFTENGEYFYSESFSNRMQMIDNVSKARSEAGKAGMMARWKKKKEITNVIKPITNVMPSDNKPITNVTKSDNNKIKENNTILTDSSKNKSLLNKRARDEFESIYESRFGEKYYWSAKDAGNMTRLLNAIKHSRSKRKEPLPIDDDSLIIALGQFLRSINNEWINQNFSVSIISSHYNEIISEIKSKISKSNGKKGTPPSNGNYEDWF